MMKTPKPLKQEARQAVIQTDKLGFYPFNSLALSALKHHPVFCIVDKTYDPVTSEAPPWKTHLQWTAGKQTIELEGKIFAGFTDAFYRGKLPELIVVTCPMLDIPHFLETLMEFLEKLCVLGFLTSPDLDENIALDEYVPQFVLASYGPVFEVVHQKLSGFIDNLSSISERQKERLLQKISRGVFTSPLHVFSDPLAPSAKPLQMLLAGDKSKYTIRAKEILDAHHIQCEFNPNGDAGILEYELNLAYRHITSQTLHQLPGKDKNREKNLTTLMDTLGQKLGIMPGLVTAKRDYLDPSAMSKEPSMLDLAILHQVANYAEKVDLAELGALITEWLVTLEQGMKPA